MAVSWSDKVYDAIADIETAIELLDNIVGTVDSAAPTSAALAGGSDGTNIRAMHTDADGDVQVDVLSSALPTGAATEATLLLVKTAVELIDDTVATTGSAAPAKGILAVGDDGSAARALKTDSDGHLQTDVLSSALPTGAATAALQTTGNTALAAIQTAVELLDDTVGTDGSTSPTKGLAILGKDGSGNSQHLLTDTDGHLQVDVLTTGSTTTVVGPAADGATASGNPVRIGGKDGSGNTQDIITDTDGHLQVDILSSALPSGAATSALQTTGNTALAAIQTATELIDDGIGTVGSAVVAKGMQALGSDGTNARILKTDASGELQIDVLTSALPSGAAEELTLQAVQTAVELIDDTVATPGAAAPSKGILLVGDESGTARSVAVDSLGNLQVDVLASALPSGASTSALQTTGNTTLSSIETNQTDASQKTQVVDGSGNVIASSSNSLKTYEGGAIEVSVNWTTNTGTEVTVSVGVADTVVYLTGIFSDISATVTATERTLRISQATGWTNGDRQEHYTSTTTATGTTISDVPTEPIPFKTDGSGNLYLKPVPDAGNTSGDADLFFRAAV